MLTHPWNSKLKSVLLAGLVYLVGCAIAFPFLLTFGGPIPVWRKIVGIFLLPFLNFPWFQNHFILGILLSGLTAGTLFQLLKEWSTSRKKV